MRVFIKAIKNSLSIGRQLWELQLIHSFIANKNASLDFTTLVIVICLWHRYLWPVVTILLFSIKNLLSLMNVRYVYVRVTYLIVRLSSEFTIRIERKKGPLCFFTHYSLHHVKANNWTWTVELFQKLAAKCQNNKCH